MASAAGLRPNHYEVLGLSPKASEHEIAEAFASKMGRFGARSVTAAAQMSIAFQVLRDAAKRRAYDRAIGVIADPPPRQWGMTAPAPRTPGFIGAAWGRLTEEDVAATVARPIEVAEAPRKPAPRPQRKAAPQIEPLPAIAAADERPIDWRRPVLAVGGLVLAAGIVGTMAGLSVKDSEDAAPAATTTVALPPVMPHPRIAAPVAATAVSAPAAAIQTHRSVARTRRPIEPPHAAFAEKAVDQIEAVAAQPADPAPVETAVDQDPLAPKAAVAAMPLSKSVIARTIDRIGYSCGTVVSTAPAGSGAGYTVTCSSGQSYRATPVHGHYRFHRAG